MFLLLLLLPFLLRLLGARDVPKDTNYVIKKITSCPDVGYYFRREPIPNAIGLGPCYLCFCQDDGTAICWKRENKKCDAFSYKHHDISKRETRVRRSPFSLTDIFFKDAKRELTSNVKAEECKPFESSFSEDCPPADWCVGCTVCDCDTTGHWDCHLLSFCPDKNHKNKMITVKKPLKKPKKSQTKSRPSKPTKTTTRSPSTKRTTKKPNKPLKRPNRQAQNRNTSLRPHRRKHKKHNKPSPKPLVIHKGTTKPKTTKNYKMKESDRDMITKEILNSVMAVMRKLYTNSQLINNQLQKVLPSPRSIQKRSMDKNQNKHFKKYKPPSSKRNQYNRTVLPKQHTPKIFNQMSGARRYKREIPDKVIKATEISKIDAINKTGYKLLTKNAGLRNATNVYKYYKYDVMTGKPLNTTEMQNYRVILYGESYNDSFENEVQQFAKKDKEFHIVAMDDFEKKPKLRMSNEKKLIEEKFTPNDTTSNINETKNKGGLDIHKNDDKYVTAKTVNVISSTQTSINNNAASFGNAATTVNNRVNSIDVTPNFKYTTKNIVDTLKHESVNVTKSVPSHKEKSVKSRVFKKIADIQNVFKNLLHDFRTTNNYTKSTTEKPKRKKFDVLKYLKKFFRKVFRRKSKGKISKNSTIEKNKLRHHVVDAICEIFNNCVINKRNKKLLESKINDLYIESNNIFRSIKIIKGLLHLINFGSVSNNTGKPYFKDDITKLNYILQNEYENSEQDITENQSIQIQYIKSNTQLFIQSVSKFAKILNDIIATLTTPNADKMKIDQRSRRNVKDNLTKKDSGHDQIIKDLIKLKNILKKYNLMQNTFMRKMYETLNKFGSTQDNSTSPQVSSQNIKEINTALSIEKFSRNIIENLRKLRNLAVMMNSNNRRKRNAVEDGDTVEYLLTLMEYMLKQSYPIDTAPVSDGIDLLIEAIKSAPDIKPMREQVLKSMPKQNIKISVAKTKAPPKQASDDVSEYNRLFKEDNFTIVSNRTDDGSAEQNVYQAKDDEYIKFHKQINLNSFDENTGSVLKYSSPSTPNSDETDETTLPYQTEKKNEANKKEFDMSKFENESSGRKKFDIYSADMEEEDSNAETTSTTVASETESNEVEREVLTTTEAPLVTTQTKLDKVTQKPKSGESGDSNDNEKRVSLDWLDEGYDQEVKASVENVTTTTTTTTSTQRPFSPKQDNAVSSITKESSYEDDRDMKNQAKWTSEQLMRKKQMDLLNSLDYGTEKSDSEDSADTKEEKDDTIFGSYYS